MNIRGIAKAIGGKLAGTVSEVPISGISIDSRTIKRNEVFVAIRGAEFDGHNFVNEAVIKGASAVVLSSGWCHRAHKTPVIYVNDTRRALAVLAGNFYRDPSESIKIIGITGTNGKTTVSYLVEEILNAAGRPAGRIGTINYKIKERLIEPPNTTPSVLLLNQLLREMADRSLDYAVTEISSHSLAQHRTDGINFNVALFTNISPEHLDYHECFSEYLNAKKRLFSGLNPDAAAVLNADDPHAEDIKEAVSARKVFSFGMGKNTDVRARNLRLGLNGSRFILDTYKGNVSIDTSLIGAFNVSNIMAAAGAALAEDIDLDAIKKGIEALKEVPGRLQPVRIKKGTLVFIDYAHTDDALKKVLEALKALKKENLIVVFGCGGDRDRAKRPRMGRAAAELADLVIITSDNPRNEDPGLIAEEIREGTGGFKCCEIMLDRRKAIGRALSIAGREDFVLIAGKGHENFQIIGDKKIPFNDEEVVKEILGYPMLPHGDTAGGSLWRSNEY